MSIHLQLKLVAAPALEIGMLGEFYVHAGAARPVPISSKKNRALLAVLALSPALTVSRAKLAGFLWSDRDGEHSRSSLRQSLAVLRKELGEFEPHILRVARDDVSLSAENLRVDALEFLRLAGSESVQSLRQAADLYRGDLLADIGVRDPAFDDWLAAKQAEFKEVAIRALDRLRLLLSGTARIAVAQRLLALDPLREASHRALMQALADEGENGLALKQFDACTRVLRQELDVEVAAETRELRDSIADGRGEPPQARSGPSTEADLQPSKPSIAVLPFSNLGDDPRQQYLGDGLAEDLTTELTRYRSLFVIGSLSAFSVRDLGLDVKSVSRRLRTRYLVTGRFRRLGNELQINIQLINAETDQAVWADRFHGTADQLAEFQEVVVRKIAARVEGHVASHERALLLSRPKRNWRAYDFVLRGRYALSHYDVEAAGESFRQALEIDPQIAEAHAYLAKQLIVRSWMGGDGKDIELARSHARLAVESDANDARAHTAMAYVCQYGGELEAAGPHYQRAAALNPNDSLILNYTGLWHTYMGDARRGLELMDRALERDPFPTSGIWSMRGNTFYQLKDYRETVACIDRMATPSPWDIPYVAAALSRLGDEPSLRRLRSSFRARLTKDYPALLRHAEQEPYRLKRDSDHLFDGLRLARSLVEWAGAREDCS